MTSAAEHAAFSTRFRRSTLLLLLGAALLCPASAQAQGRFSVLRFSPAPTHLDYFNTLDGRVLGHLVPSLGFYLHYDHAPLTVASAASDETLFDEVAYQLNAELMVAFGLWDRLQLDLMLPISLLQGSDDRSVGLSAKPDLSAGLGDLRAGIKLRAFTAAGFSLALQLALYLPTGSHEDYLGDDGVSGEVKVIGSFTKGRFGAALNIGVRFRPDQSFNFDSGPQNIAVNDELWFSAGLRYAVLPEQLDLMADGHTVLAVNELDAEERSGEVLFGARYHLPLGFAATLGAGPGIGRGVGTPAFRIFAGLFWRHSPPKDPDGDGLIGDRDQCPNEPEDKDGFKDDDGCPDPDNDDDGIPDTKDKCPNKPEDKDGFEDDDGCPDLDNDNDGIADAEDKCPNKAEDKDGFEDDDGCPDPDNDNDGIPDTQDKCPNKPEDKDGFADDDGCPDPDNDNDGIPDTKDKCPNEPETVNGVKDDDGCPDRSKSKVQIQHGKITVPAVYFATGRDRILKRSYSVLVEVAKTLNSNAWIKKVRIEGHTDARGRDDKNLDLSKRRARSVFDFLVENKVDKARLIWEGYGETRPIASNKTGKGRAQNRRVEFVIVDPKTANK